MDPFTTSGYRRPISREAKMGEIHRNQVPPTEQFFHAKPRMHDPSCAKPDNRIFVDALNRKHPNIVLTSTQYTDGGKPSREYIPRFQRTGLGNIAATKLDMSKNPENISTHGHTTDKIQIQKASVRQPSYSAPHDTSVADNVLRDRINLVKRATETTKYEARGAPISSGNGITDRMILTGTTYEQKPYWKNPSMNTPPYTRNYFYKVDPGTRVSRIEGSHGTATRNTPTSSYVIR